MPTTSRGSDVCCWRLRWNISCASTNNPVPDVPSNQRISNLKHNKFPATRTVSFGASLEPMLLKPIFKKPFILGGVRKGWGFVDWLRMSFLMWRFGSKYGSTRCSSIVDVCNEVMRGELWCKNISSIIKQTYMYMYCNNSAHWQTGECVDFDSIYDWTYTYRCYSYFSISFTVV